MMRANKLDEAAVWLATGGRDKRRPVVPQLCERYGFTAQEACDVMRRARSLKETVWMRNISSRAKGPGPQIPINGS